MVIYGHWIISIAEACDKVLPMAIAIMAIDRQ